MTHITQEIIDRGLSYHAYRKQVNEWLSKGMTSGDNHSPSMLNYTYINNKRMNRWDKTLILSEALISSLGKIRSRQYWVVLVEAWCGDVAQNVPAIAKMAEQNENIVFKLIFRDENPEIMDTYRTEGARSIPKLIILDNDLIELTIWGPRPEPVQHMLEEYKKNPDESYQEYAQKAHTWYAKNRNTTIQEEFLRLLNTVNLDHLKVA